MKLKLSHILVDHRYEAEDLLRKLDQGEKFEDLARKFSKCSSARNQGSLGEIDLRRLDTTFAEAAQILEPGDLSPIVKTRFGHHIIRHDP